MPAPTNANALTLGPPLIDSSMFSPETDPAVVTALMRIQMTLAGMGYPAPKRSSGDAGYQQVYAQNDGGWTLYAGKPTDPLNPDEITGLGGAGTGLDTFIWGLDVNGGHTLTAVGTTLTLTLKITKYTVTDGLITAEADDQVVIEYDDGEECS